MTDRITLNWPRYALIAHLADRLEGRSPWFGKTALQKIIYLLQELYDLDLGYRFSLYTYGPFSKELASDLDFVHTIDGVAVDYDEEVGGYRISGSSENVAIQNRAQQFLEGNEGPIRSVCQDFGPLQAKELELLATIIYVDADFKEKEEGSNFETLVEKVQGIKPHFRRRQIEEAVTTLSERGLVLDMEADLEE